MVSLFFFCFPPSSFNEKTFCCFCKPLALILPWWVVLWVGVVTNSDAVGRRSCWGLLADSAQRSTHHASPTPSPFLMSNRHCALAPVLSITQFYPFLQIFFLSYSPQAISPRIFVSCCLSSRSSSGKDTGFTTAVPLPSSSSSAGAGHWCVDLPGFVSALVALQLS